MLFISSWQQLYRPKERGVQCLLKQSILNCQAINIHYNITCCFKITMTTTTIALFIYWENLYIASWEDGVTTQQSKGNII